MSFRSALTRGVTPLHPEFVTKPPVGGGEAKFRFAVPVLRVRDVATTVAWYRRHLGFTADSFPERGEHEFAILERDGVQLLVRRAREGKAAADKHSGWDLYMWIDGADLGRLESVMSATASVVRPLTPMGASMAELEIRDPDGYVLCLGGPTAINAALTAN